MKIPNIADIQDAIDDQLRSRNLGKYLEYAKYLPKDEPAPADATHVLTLESRNGAKVQVALKAKGLYAFAADLALQVL